MAGDLFAGTFERKPAPRRSKWTIAGSFVAHTVLLGALLVLPVLSAFDNYVVHARNFTVVVPSPPVMPATPAAPPKTAMKPPSDINPEAAPREAPQNVVTDEKPVIIGPPVPPGALPIGDGRGPIPGIRGGDLVNLSQHAPPPEPPRKPLRPGGNISAPTRVSFVNPIYPHLAVVSKTEGYVILEAIIDESGAVTDVKVLKSIPLLDQAAIDAVKRWRYTPTRLNGVAVPIILSVTVTFSLR